MVERQRSGDRIERLKSFLRLDPANPALVRELAQACHRAGDQEKTLELCARLTTEDEKAFEQLWKHLGLSVDWSLTYATISRAAQQVSQAAFLRLLDRKLAYQLEAPTLWDIDFKTARRLFTLVSALHWRGRGDG